MPLNDRTRLGKDYAIASLTTCPDWVIRVSLKKSDNLIAKTQINFYL